MAYIVLTQEYGETHKRDFDAFDTKGRQFGACATIVDHIFRNATEEEINRGYMFNYAEEGRRNRVTAPTTRFGFRPHAMRNGSSYGSSHGTKLFDTEAARDQAIERYFVDAEKRAMKNKARAA